MVDTITIKHYDNQDIFQNEAIKVWTHVVSFMSEHQLCVDNISFRKILLETDRCTSGGTTINCLGAIHK